MFPQWVNQSNFYTYIFKQFEYHYANQLPFDIHPYINEFTKEMNEEEKELFLINSDALYNQSYNTLFKDGELINKKLETYRDLKYYSNQIFAALPKDSKYTKSKILKKYQSALASLIRDYDYQDVESDSSLLVSKTYEYAQMIGDLILENDFIIQYIILFLTKINLDLFHESEVAGVLHGYFILLQHYFHDLDNQRVLDDIKQIVQEEDLKQIVQLLKKQADSYFDEADKVEEAVKELSDQAKKKKIQQEIKEYQKQIDTNPQVKDMPKNWMEAMFDEHFSLENEEVDLFADTYYNHKERIHQKCENYYTKYFNTNQAEKEKILSYMIFAETPRKYDQEEYNEYFSMNANKRNYPFLEQMKHYCYYDLLKAYMDEEIEFYDFASSQYSHRFINLYLQIFSEIMYNALIFAYRSNPKSETYLVSNLIEQDLMNQLKSNRRAQLNYEHFIVDIPRFHDYPLTLRNNLLRVYPEHQNIYTAIFCLLIDFDKNIDFFFNKLKEATIPFEEDDERENVYFYPINQKKSELSKNTQELETKNTIDPYISIYPNDSFNAVYNFIELYKQDPFTLAAGSLLNRMILQLINNFDDPSTLNDQIDQYTTLEEEETFEEYKEAVSSSKFAIDEIETVDDLMKVEKPRLKKQLIRLKVITIIKKLMNLPKEEIEEYYHIAFDEALFIQKIYNYKELGMNILYSLEEHFCVIDERGRAIASLLTKYILNYPDTIFGEFLNLPEKKQYILILLITLFDNYYSVDALTIFSMVNSDNFLNEEENNKLAKKYQVLQKEVSKYEGKQKEIKQQLNALKDENEELKKQLAYYKKKEKETKDLVKPYELKINQITSQYTKQINSLQKQIENYENQSNELKKLRELVFNNENQTEEYINDTTYEREFLKEFCTSHNVVLAGGRFELQRALKNNLNIIPYGNHFSSNSDVLKNAEYIFISYKWFNHSDYAIIQNIVSSNPQIEWDYLAHDNIDLVIHDLYQFITNKK